MCVDMGVTGNKRDVCDLLCATEFVGCPVEVLLRMWNIAMHELPADVQVLCGWLPQVLLREVLLWQLLVPSLLRPSLLGVQCAGMQGLRGARLCTACRGCIG